MEWFVVYSKPRQEQRAYENLERQGYQCYLPMIRIEKIRRKELGVLVEPLFPRYLFIHLDTGLNGKGWGPIRSTFGVAKMVTFGGLPATIDARLIEALKRREEGYSDTPLEYFSKGERVVVTDGPFIGVEGIYRMSDGASRALVLIEMLSKPTELAIEPDLLRKV